MPTTPMDHLRSTKKARTKTVWIAGDTEAVDDLESARETLRKAKLRHDVNPTPETLAELSPATEDEASAARYVKETSIKFVFRSIGRRKFEQLFMDHPPTDAQREAAKAKGDELNFNEDTFPAALVHACLVEPHLEPEEVKEIIEGGTDGEWNSAEVGILFTSAMEVNQTRKLVDLGNG